jgi:hypothetical protein
LASRCSNWKDGVRFTGAAAPLEPRYLAYRSVYRRLVRIALTEAFGAGLCPRLGEQMYSGRWWLVRDIDYNIHKNRLIFIKIDKTGSDCFFIKTRSVMIQKFDIF